MLYHYRQSISSLWHWRIQPTEFYHSRPSSICLTLKNSVHYIWQSINLNKTNYNLSSFQAIFYFSPLYLTINKPDENKKFSPLYFIIIQGYHLFFINMKNYVEYIISSICSCYWSVCCGYILVQDGHVSVSQYLICHLKCVKW